MSELSEHSVVELPFVEQLRRLGWGYLQGDTEVPYLTERESFHQVLLLDRLRQAVTRINLDEAGQPWMEDSQVAQAVGRLERLGAHHLMEANAEAYELLRNGTQVEGTNGRQHTVQFADYAHPERNDWLVINQFRVDPPGSSDGRGCIIPDIVLLVNGIPLVVIECKTPGTENPLEQAITQLLR
jgi:type I restriction enzyme R subunit